MDSSREVRTLTTPQELFAAVAEEVFRATEEAIKDHGRFTIALSGGSTPKSLYNLLATNARIALPWDKMFFFWSDERHVAPDDPESNYRMANEAMLSKVAVPPANIFRIPTENPDADAVARTYEQTLLQFFNLKAGQVPRFDLILLGLGPDAHTASLFPGTAGLKETSKLVIANWVEKLKTSRLSFTFPLINAAERVAFLVSGTDKATVLKTVLEGDASGDQYPAKMVRPTNGKLIWFVDRAAASGLAPTPA